MRRMLFWNEHELFRKKDALTSKEIFSTYPEAAPVKIYEHDYWWSDKWDPMDYGRDYDFSRPFFEQFKELAEAVPRPARAVINLVNSDYCNQASDLKNCYLVFNGNTMENCAYVVAALKMRNCLDAYQSGECELCYEGFSIAGAYANHFSAETGGCRDSWFLLNCRDCSDCFGCVNLRHKKYHIFNEPYTKEEYEKKLKEFNLGSHKSLLELKKKTRDFWLKFPRKYANVGVMNTNVEASEYVYRSKNVKYSYQGLNMENVRYAQSVAEGVKDTYDYTSWGHGAELFYEAASCGTDSRSIKFCYDCWPACEDIEYSMGCHSSTNLFGCMGLSKKQYCIFNKQYTKEEYKGLVAKIKEHMDKMLYKDKKGRVYKYGEFFPPELSPLAYNETAAQDIFPLDEKQAEKMGFLWRPMDRKEFEATISAADLPDHVKDTAENITNEKIACLGCKRAYRIIPMELEFYKRMGIPLPRLCPNCRYLERISWRNPLKWRHGQCQCAGSKSDNGVYKNDTAHAHGSEHCPNEFETFYTWDRPEIVYCESCYNSEIV